MNCSTCIYWNPKSGKEGECRYAPPPAHVQTSGGLRGVWRITLANEWCGSWRRKNGESTGDAHLGRS